LNRHRKAKIVATVGPASTDAATLETMFRAGADGPALGNVASVLDVGATVAYTNSGHTALLHIARLGANGSAE
jgi:pyruvate kinase